MGLVEWAKARRRTKSLANRAKQGQNQQEQSPGVGSTQSGEQASRLGRSSTQEKTSVLWRMGLVEWARAVRHSRLQDKDSEGMGESQANLAACWTLKFDAKQHARSAH